MLNNFYKKVEEFVIDSFSKAGDNESIKHLLRAAYWVSFLKPEADEALLIATVAHDIERAFRNHKNYDFIKSSEQGFKSDEHLNYHQAEGARIIGNYLGELGASEELILRVKMLVLKHEVGGDDDQNLLKDADSLSFFENNIDHFLSKKVNDTGKEKVKDKFIWMFDRITSKEAKEVARPWYEEALRRLEI